MKNNIFSKTRFAVLLFSVFVITGSMLVSARHIGNYDMIMPRGGGISYTDSLTKTGTTRAVNNNTSIGGGYTMHCAIYKNSDSSKLSSTKICGSGDRVMIDYNNASSANGMSVKMGGWTSLTTTVKVQTSGTWSPDEN